MEENASRGYDDLAVTRLRSAGAIIVGTNTMMGTSAPGPFQFNWEHEARNPWDPSRAPGWSSSGGAATAAARLLPIAIGSDGGGSTRLPGAYCGVVGMHPTAGLVPSYNPAVQMRMNPTVTIGPLARDITDVAVTLQALSGPDGRDFDCIQTPPPDMLSHLDDGVEGFRLAWTDDYGFAGMYGFDESPRVIEAVRDAAVPVVRSLGAVIEESGGAWEDFWPGYVTAQFLFGGGPTGTMERPPRDTWMEAMESRGRNWEAFRKVFAETDLLLSPTSQILAPKIEDWAAWWSGNGPVPFPHGTFAPHYTSHTHMFNWLGHQRTGNHALMHTTNAHAYNPAVPVPYDISIVELEEQEGLRFTTNVVECSPDDVHIGHAGEVRLNSTKVPLVFAPPSSTAERERVTRPR